MWRGSRSKWWMKLAAEMKRRRRSRIVFRWGFLVDEDGKRRRWDLEVCVGASDCVCEMNEWIYIYLWRKWGRERIWCIGNGNRNGNWNWNADGCSIYEARLKFTRKKTKQSPLFSSSFSHYQPKFVKKKIPSPPNYKAKLNKNLIYI